MSIISHPRKSTFCKEQVADVSHTTYDRVSGSPTKLKYSFGMSKAIRFPKVKLKNHEQIGYDLPTTKKPRAAGFGIGERFQDQAIKLTKNQNPSPDRYNIPTLFNPNNTTSTFANHMKGELTYSFGTGRDGFTKTVYNERIGNNKRIHVPDPVTPGPGTYDPQHPLGVGSKSFKLKGKIAYGSVSYSGRDAERKGIPGAGTYDDTLSLNNLGLYNQNSQFVNSKAAKWSPPYDRFFRPRITTDENPGPGQHEQYGEVAQGKQVATKFHSTKTPSFGIGGRSRWTQRFQTPGPGAYRPPSDFGYVDINKFIEKNYGVAATAFKSQINRLEVDPIPEKHQVRRNSPSPMRGIENKKMYQSASQSDAVKREGRKASIGSHSKPSKFRPPNNYGSIHKRNSTMNPSSTEQIMNQTQDLGHAKQAYMNLQESGRPIAAEMINYQNSTDVQQQHEKLFIKKNLNARTMRNTFQAPGAKFTNSLGMQHKMVNQSNNVTPTMIPQDSQDYDEQQNYINEMRTRTQPRESLGLTPGKYDSSEIHHMSLMTPNNQSLLSPSNNGPHQGASTASNIDTAANTLTPYGQVQDDKDISTITAIEDRQ